jgi:filamentous hemagglutinin family protein
MTVNGATSSTGSARRKARHAMLLAGVSAAALFMAAPGTYAKPLGGGGSAPPVATAPAVAPQAGQAALQAQAAMKRAMQSIQAMQAAQRAAREAAANAASNIPNGLQAGGLEVKAGAIPGSQLWQGANGPTQRISAGRTQVGIEQTQAKAILTWETFNIGKDTDLTFDQKGNKDWIALNRVLDPSTAPSRILGNLSADGQVYVINRNGIIFGGSSQVNVNTLIASSLSLSNEQFMAGINNPQKFSPGGGTTYFMPQFGDHATEMPSWQAAGDPGQVAPFVPTGVPGDVTVEAGAHLSTASGGKLMLFAPRITNAGILNTADGQAILAAGEQVWLSSDINGVRGLDVAVSGPMPYLINYADLLTVLGLSPFAGDFTNSLASIVFPAMEARAEAVGYNVTNTGVIHAERGNITLQSHKVVQNGVLTATTALNNREGSIRLRAWGQGMLTYSDNTGPAQPGSWSAGTLTLGSDSVVAILPDVTDTGEIEMSALATRYKPGSIYLSGNLVDVQSRASLIAPSGSITIIASKVPLQSEGTASAGPTSAPMTGLSSTTQDGSRIYIDSDAFLSVAGLQDVVVAMERNFVHAQLYINELRDSPLYRDSWLRGEDVIVDRRKGGTFDSGPMAGVLWMTDADGNDLPGQWVGTPLADVTGWVGVGKTDLLELSTKGGSITLKAGGSIITRKDALLDVSGGSVRYTGGWNLSTKLLGADGLVYDIGNATSDMTYVGFAGGFTRSNAHWGVSQTWNNPLSKTAPTWEAGYTEGRNAGSITMYSGGGMVLENSYWAGVIPSTGSAANAIVPKAGSLQLGGGGDPDRMWSPVDVMVTDRPVVLAADFDATATLDDVFYQPSLPGSLPVQKTTWLDSAILKESGLGEIAINVMSGFTLEEGTHLELAPKAAFGVFVNQNEPGKVVVFQIDGSIRAAGGAVTFSGNGLGQINLGAAAAIDVSGEWVNDITNGASAVPPSINGGSITLKGDVYTTLSVTSTALLDVSGGGWVQQTGKGAKLQAGDAGSILLGGLSADTDVGALNLRAYAIGSGGSLALETPAPLQIGGDVSTAPGVFRLSSTLYGERGFRSIGIFTEDSIVVSDGALISQIPVSVDVQNGNYLDKVSGTKITDVGSLGILPVERRAGLKPTSLSLASGADILVGAGAVLRANIGGSVILTSKGNTVIRGTIDAPAGEISVDAQGALHLAAGAELLARGTPVIWQGVSGRTGSVASGGAVTLIAGSLLKLDAGSLIDVSGSSGTIDVPASGMPRVAAQPLTLVSNGGAISLQSGKSGASIDASLRAQGGGAGATGGSLSIADVKVGDEALLPEALPSTLYWTAANGTLGRGSADSLDLDIFDEYGTDPILFTYEMLDAINRLPGSITGGMVIVPGTANDPNGPASTLTPSEIDPAIDPRVVDLINRHFWFGTGSRPVNMRLISKIDIPNIANGFTRIAQSSIDRGGFGTVSLGAANGLTFNQGVNLALSGGLSINASRVTNGGTGGSAHLAAAYITINQSDSVAPAYSSGVLGGTLTLSASVIDIVGQNYIRDFADTRFEATDIRMASNTPLGQTAPPVLLDVEGNLILKAGQIYPTTGVRATIHATQQITVERNGNPAAPLSAGGILTLEAPLIAQNGVLRAPFGQIVLKAADRLMLGSGSITSVSGAGLVVPYGFLSNGEHWLDPTLPDNPDKPNYLNAPPEKRITLDAPVVDAAAGSVIDIRGGGDLLAREFVPGPGGSHDILSMPGTYAIMPGYSAPAAPAGGAGGVGEQIWLAGGNGIAAGWYTLLPASYAGLPGAYAVSLAGGASTWTLPNAARLSDGSTLMAGYRGNALSGTREQLSSTWRIMSGAVLRQYTEYNEAFSNTFFGSDAFKLTQYRLTGQNIVTPRLAMDGGSVVFKATQELILDGELQSQAAKGGRGGMVDIAGVKIAILGGGQDADALRADGYLVLDAGSLTGFGAGSLLVGGTRSSDPLGLRLDVTASDVVVRNDEDSALTGPEIILAASGLVDIGAGSVILADGEASVGTGDLVMTPYTKAVYADPAGTPNNPADDVLVTPSKDYGGLIRVSNGDAVKVIRENVDTGVGGIVAVGAGVRLGGGKALLIDATRNTELAASALLSGSALSVASGAIGIGGGSSGLILDTATLMQLSNAQHLTLRSYTVIDFHTSLNFGSMDLAAVTFDAAGLVGHGASDIAITGGVITLENSGGGSNAAAGTGAGTLALTADELILGAGSKRIDGFEAVTLTGRKRIVGEGNGTLDSGSAAVTLATPILTGRGGAAQAVTTTGAFALLGDTSSPAGQPEGSLGARLALTGSSVRIDGRIAALGGGIDLTATAGDVVIDAGSLIDVGGFQKTLFDISEYADAGRIGLTAIGGDVRVEQNAVLNLSAHANGGNAGSLSVTASGGGEVLLDGRITAAAKAGAKGGSFELDIEALPGFAAMSQRLNQAGFSAARKFRIRNGDVVLDGTTTVNDFSLTADKGKVIILGTVDARSSYGGRIAINGGEGLVMESTAVLLAGATDEKLGSGRVTLEAAGGTLDVRGGTINVSGGERGKVRFRALQTAGHDGIAVDNLNVTITGARSAVLEGVSVYDAADTIHASTFDGTTLDSVKSQAIDDANTFGGHAASISGDLGIDGRISVMAGIEVRAEDDLTLNSDWNLYSDFAGQREGTLTLRAGGDLIIKGNISDGFDLAGRTGVLQDTASWNVRLASGADLSSADALALTSLAELAADSGNLIIGDASAGKLVRTGTGDVDVRAGRDLDLAHAESVIYTAGRKDMTSYADIRDVQPGATYGNQGGNLTIEAQGDIESTGPDDPRQRQLFSEWLRRVGTVMPDGSFGLELGPVHQYMYGPEGSVQHYMQDGVSYGSCVITGGFCIVDAYAPTGKIGIQTTWWIDYGRFNQGVGALGGGNVDVRSGGDIKNLLVALPTNGRVRGGRTAGEDKVLEQRNGGLLKVEAEGTIRGGQYYVARGAGEIRAGETAVGHTVTASYQNFDNSIDTYKFDVAPILALGDATLSVHTAGDLRIQTVVDPMLMRRTEAPITDGQDAYFSSFTDRTALDLVSVGGDITLVNQAYFISSDVTASFNAWGEAEKIGVGGNRYPALTRVVAQNGSIDIQGPMYLMPGPVSDLRILAQQDVRFVTLDQKLGALTGIQDLNRFATQISMLRIPAPISGGPLMPTGAYAAETSLDNPERLLLADDFEPSRIYAAAGSILQADITTSEQIWLRAGKDIRNMLLDIRNLHASDVTLLEAGNDIIAVAPLRQGFGIGSITVWGPGGLMLAAGRDIHADRMSIMTMGNQTYDANNRPIIGTQINGLPEESASITLMAGLNGKVTYDTFAAAYLDPANVAAMPDYLKTTLPDGTTLPIYLTDLTEVREGGETKTVRRGLVSFIQEMTGDTLSPLDAWSRFQALPKLTQQSFLHRVYMQELRDAGRDQNEPGEGGLPKNGGYNRGYAAVAALFPGDGWKGNVSANIMSLRSMAGGDINVLTPGGGLQLAALGAVVPAGAGAVTLGSGHINIFTKQDVIVNRSRILTFVPDASAKGSDLIIWSTLGDIDAGRGAKTLRVPSAPDIFTDLDGNTEILERSDISGSGMGTVGDGDVDLIAPLGTVNAGDAGVRAASNLNVAALFVVNADNFEVGGKTKGLPPVESATGALTVEDAGQNGAADAARDATQSSASEQPSIIIVEVLGFGGGDGTEESPEEEERKRRRQSSLNYDPNSTLRVLGNGEMSAEEAKALTEPEKKLLAGGGRGRF